MVDANYTLANFNGVIDEARNQVLVLTGALSAQRNLIAPLVEKTYIIRNTTTGGFGVQIIGSSGTGVIIPNGTTASVFCDGTNFFPATTGSLGNQVINGNLSVTGTTSLTGALTASTATFSGAISSVSPTFTGTPTAPTAISGTNTTQIATTAFVQNIAGTLGTMSTQNANNVNITGGVIGSAVTGATQAVTTNNTSIATTAFVRSIIPAGVILMWSGSVASIPSGWLLCNGSSGTPDLRDRFIVGAGSSYAVGATGGSATNTLTTSELPSHTHSLSASGTTSSTNIDHTHSGTTGGMNSNASHTHSISDPGHQHIQGSFNARPQTGTSAIYGTNDPTPDAGNQFTVAAVTGITINSTNIDHTHSITTGGMNSNTTHTHTVTVTGTSGATGSGAAFTNLPPYYALAYIMKT
jgi:microcystin-dependent protein